jgi:hypothetical protein
MALKQVGSVERVSVDSVSKYQSHIRASWKDAAQSQAAAAGAVSAAAALPTTTTTATTAATAATTIAAAETKTTTPPRKGNPPRLVNWLFNKWKVASVADDPPDPTHHHHHIVIDTDRALVRGEVTCLDHNANCLCAEVRDDIRCTARPCDEATLPRKSCDRSSSSSGPLPPPPPPPPPLPQAQRPSPVESYRPDAAHDRVAHRHVSVAKGPTPEKPEHDDGIRHDVCEPPFGEASLFTPSMSAASSGTGSVPDDVARGSVIPRCGAVDDGGGGHSQVVEEDSAQAMNEPPGRQGACELELQEIPAAPWFGNFGDKSRAKPGCDESNVFEPGSLHRGARGGRQSARLSRLCSNHSTRASPSTTTSSSSYLEKLPAISQRLGMHRSVGTNSFAKYARSRTSEWSLPSTFSRLHVGGAEKPWFGFDVSDSSGDWEDTEFGIDDSALLSMTEA